MNLTTPQKLFTIPPSSRLRQGFAGQVKLWRTGVTLIVLSATAQCSMTLIPTDQGATDNVSSLAILATDVVLRDHLPKDLLSQKRVPDTLQDLFAELIAQQKQNFGIFFSEKVGVMAQALPRLYKANVDTVILDSITDYNSSLLGWAIYWNQEDCVRQLIQRDANLNSPTCPYNKTPLTLAVDRDTNILKLLLANKADPNVPDGHGYIPLLKAVGPQNLEHTSLLLQAGANPDAQDEWSQPALFRILYSIRSTHNLEKCLSLTELLLQHRANPSICNKEGMPILTKARELLECAASRGWNNLIPHYTRFIALLEEEIKKRAQTTLTDERITS